ncbi:hypothetical protein RIF25_03260 [Thermosynechococcaceae cyanobacterium BACA0444]|uniref:Uncharacterized protein n=1 Tax=Pseudocalidococcus azoricus BACA0444 TaxID=2918990 RepID=A0AAE4FPP4_9CYAN|nr:hypothetical protein [Pseudocalidococcus azoricus]MDS3859820.1 hypothetical protein [Pseudocalidococcus azoricus BACA0444]
MAQTLTFCDEYGIIYQVMRILPSDQLKIRFVEALAELEDHECHRKRTFPKTRLHKIKGIKQAIYRADIDKISGWRIHIQYLNGKNYLKDIIEGQKHDDVLDIIKSKKGRYD